MESKLNGEQANGVTDKVHIRVQPVPGSVTASEINFRSVLIVIASFLCNGIIFGVVNSVSVIYTDLVKSLKEGGDNDASAKASLVGSLAIGMTFFTSAIAGVLTDQLGIRTTALTGALLASGGMLASSFFCQSVEALYFTFGIMFGVGASLVYTPSLVILGHYFHRYLGAVNGFVTAGSSVFTLAMPHILHIIITAFGLKGCLLFLSALLSVLIVCALMFVPVPSAGPPKKRQSLGKTRCSEFINVSLFKRKRYLIWTIATPIAFLGYFVPYVHNVTFVRSTLPNCDGKLLITFIAAMSLISRIGCGLLADLPSVNSIILQQVSFVLLGALTMLLVVANSWPLMIVLTLGMGICDGFSVTLIGPIAFELCGKEGASQAIGFLLGICSIPMTMGPVLAGFLFDLTDSYTIPYVMSGAVTVFGAVIMLFIHCIKNDSVTDAPYPDAIEFEVMKPLYTEGIMPDARPLPPSYKITIAGKTTNGKVNQETT